MVGGVIKTKNHLKFIASRLPGSREIVPLVSPSTQCLPLKLGQ